MGSLFWFLNKKTFFFYLHRNMDHYHSITHDIRQNRKIEREYNTKDTVSFY